jgi:hypothetical protein
VRLVSEANLGCECSEVSLAVGESIQRLAYFESAAESADCHAAAAVEEPAQMVGRQLGDPGQVSQTEPGIGRDRLPDLIHHSFGPPLGGEARRDRLWRQTRHDGPNQQDRPLGQLLCIGARHGPGEERAVRDIDGRGGEDRSIGSVPGQRCAAGGRIEHSTVDGEGGTYVSAYRMGDPLLASRAFQIAAASVDHNF